MSSLRPGTPLNAPKGFRNLKADITYYFIRSSPRTLKVTMVRFEQREAKEVVYPEARKPKRRISPQPLPLIERMSRSDFEAGLRLHHIEPSERKPMPPWLSDLQGRDLELFDASRRKATKSHAERIDEKLFAINSLVQRAEEILDEDDVERVINRHARSLQPRQNETRVRLWFLVFIAFGRDRNVLFYPTSSVTGAAWTGFRR